jgi:protein ImuB
MICCLVSKSSLPPPGALEAVARLCSPRVMTCGRTAVMFDASGLTGAIGPPAKIVDEVRRLAAADGLVVRAAMAGTMSAAWLLAHASTPATVIEPGTEAAVLAPLPLSLLRTLPASAGPASGPERSRAARASGRAARPRSRHYRLAPGPPRLSAAVAEAGLDDTLMILARWGLSTLGDFGRLPRADVRTRLGAPGVRLHQAACGEDDAPLVPAGEQPAFITRIELDWPIDGLEPLSFVLARACEALSVRLEQADRGAVSLTTRLRLVTRETHARTLDLPAPMREARVLRTLILLDLESHPPGAAIDAIELELGVTPGRIEQGSLLDRTLPSPEASSTLLARLTALAGESRVGSPTLVDSYDDRVVAVSPFRVPADSRAHRRDTAATTGHQAGDVRAPDSTCPVLRRFRLPVVARVTVARGAPVRIEPAARGLAGGRVVTSAGPWRSSGHWWSLERAGWDRDAWDVEIDAGICYRLARDRTTGRWEIEGTVD